MFEIHRSADTGLWHWSLRLAGGANSRIIACNESGFAKRSSALRDIERVRELAPTAGTIEVLPRIAPEVPVNGDPQWTHNPKDAA